MGAGAWIQVWDSRKAMTERGRAGEMEGLEYKEMVEVMVFKLKWTVEGREDRRRLRKESREGHVC